MSGSTLIDLHEYINTKTFAAAALTLHNYHVIINEKAFELRALIILRLLTEKHLLIVKLFSV